MADQEPIKKKHHYVPSFLLSGFAVEDVLWATDLFEMKQWESIPDRVGLERHYNTTPARNHRPVSLRIFSGPAKRKLRRSSKRSWSREICLSTMSTMQDACKL